MKVFFGGEGGQYPSHDTAIVVTQQYAVNKVNVAGSIDEREEDDLCSSNHFILDRIAEKESTENLFSSGSTEDDDIDIKQVNKGPVNP